MPALKPIVLEEANFQCLTQAQRQRLSSKQYTIIRGAEAKEVTRLECGRDVENEIHCTTTHRKCKELVPWTVELMNGSVCADD